MAENKLQMKEKNNKDAKVKVKLNMVSAIPSEKLTTDPIIYQADEVVEIDEELAGKWTTEKYRLCSTKMCERKGGDFLQAEYITRACYI